MKELYRNFQQTLYSKVAEDSFDSKGLAGAYLAKISTSKKNILVAKQTIHSLLTSEQRSQMVSMMKKKT